MQLTPPTIIAPKYIRFCFYLLLLALFIWDGYLYTLPTKTSIYNYLFNAGYALLYLLGGILGLGAVIRLKTKTSVGRAAFFLSIALISYAVALGIWAYYNIILKIDIPYPSLADVFFVLYIPTIALGFFYLLKLFSTIISKSIIIESVIILLVAALFIFGFFLNLESSPTSLFATILNILYPLSDVILISIAFITLRLGGGKISSSILFFIIGLFFQVGADLIFGFRTTHSLYWNGDISDLLFSISGFSLSLGLINTVEEFL